MALFGSARLRDKSLAAPEMYQPMFGADPGIHEAQPFDERIPMPQGLGGAMDIPQMRGGGFFGEGGAGRPIAGFIGDALLQMSGQRPVYAPTMQRRQESEQENAQWMNRLNVQDQLQRARQKWEWDNKPKEPAEDQFSRALEGANIRPGTPEYARMMRERAQALTTRVVMTPQGPMVIGGGYGFPSAPQADDGYDDLPPGFLPALGGWQANGGTTYSGGAGPQTPRPFR